MARLVSIGVLCKKNKNVLVNLEKTYTKALTGLAECSHIHVVCISKEGKLGIIILRITDIDQKQGIISGFYSDIKVFEEGNIH